MFLKLGSVNTLIVSSAEAASEIMKTHDLIFSDRPKSNVNKKLLYDFKDVSVAPYGEYWRQMRSICVLQLLSNKRVQSYRAVREEETALLVKKIEERSPEAVNLSELFMTLTNDIVSRAAFGRKYSVTSHSAICNFFIKIIINKFSAHNAPLPHPHYDLPLLKF